jgi:thioredoxin 1
MSEEDKELERILSRKLRQITSAPPKQVTEKKIKAEPVRVTDDTFDSFVSDTSTELKAIDFWAEWCAPCRIMEPVIEELARELAGKVAFGKLNVDENPLITQRYEIMSIPTLMIFRNGQPVDMVIGALPKQVIMQKLRSYLN